MITDEQIRSWKAAADAATPGTWEYIEGPPAAIPSTSRVASPGGTVFVREDSRVLEVASYTWSVDNAAFIAIARTAVPALVEEVERQASENERLRAALRQIYFCEMVDSRDTRPSEIARAALDEVKR
jgi:hypothetical protein